MLALIEGNEERRRDREAAALERAVQEVRDRAMRYQIDPHFLFNSLNSVSALVLDKRNDDAEIMLLRLARYYHDSLTTKPVEDIALGRKPKYLEIERVRLDDALHVDIDVPACRRGALVPSFILHPIIENAVKHGQGDDAYGPLKLRIEVEYRGRLKRESAYFSTGTSLRNVREAPSSFATSCPGVFAVCDVRSGSVKRVASSVGEGSVVVSAIWSHVNAPPPASVGIGG